MTEYPAEFTLVTEDVPRTPVHVYPKNYRGSAVEVKVYQSQGYAVEYLQFTPPASTHTYSPELAEIHTRLCNAFSWASPRSQRSQSAWSAVHSAFFLWYFSEMRARTTPGAWAKTISEEIRVRAEKEERGVREAMIRVAIVVEGRLPPRRACVPCQLCERLGEPD